MQVADRLGGLFSLAYYSAHIYYDDRPPRTYRRAVLVAESLLIAVQANGVVFLARWSRMGDEGLLIKV